MLEDTLAQEDTVLHVLPALLWFLSSQLWSRKPLSSCLLTIYIVPRAKEEELYRLIFAILSILYTQKSY